MAVNRQKIWQINFNKYNAVGGGLKYCHPLNYKNTTVNQSPPHVGERGNFLWIAQKHEVKDYDNDEVLGLCEKLCDCKFESIKQMLSNNSFYRSIIR